MREFFQGWRRKSGLALLAMALLLTAAWFRSLVLTDIFATVAFGDHHVVQSGHGVVVWARQLGFTIFIDGWYSHDTIEHRTIVSKSSKWNEAWKPAESWRCCWQYGIGDAAVGCHEQVEGGGRLRTLWWRAPYWELVLPLTLLSGWLILAKPRPAKTAKEPKHD